jgi:DNA-binding response OmpR family regulator
VSFVLVVDDDPLWLEIHERILRRGGHEVRTFTSAVDALEGALDGYDLIVTDLDMPLLNGADFAREVRDRLRHFAPPMILVSAFVETCPDWAALFAAAHRKPYARAVFLADVERVLRAPRPRQAMRSEHTLRAVCVDDELDDVGHT